MSTAPAPRTRLPRVKSADKPRPGEKILKQTQTDLNNGWLGRHGKLSLTPERVVFVPTPLDTLLGAKRREIMLDDVRAVERWPLSPGEMPRGAKRPRLFIDTPDVRYIFLPTDLDGWFDILQLAFYRRSQERPGAGMPEFRRTGVDNALIETVESLRSLNRD
jgi:hypothetical protein